MGFGKIMFALASVVALGGFVCKDEGGGGKGGQNGLTNVQTEIDLKGGKTDTITIAPICSGNGNTFIINVGGSQVANNVTAAQVTSALSTITPPSAKQELQQKFEEALERCPPR